MADDPTAATPEANVPNVRFYHSFTRVLWYAICAIALLLIALAVLLVR
ncbi:MAG: hypothetical protein JO290_13340 [Sphingomonadaceae bacterium]|nr:hypothetical protein [Sphingomonadaceae bacterium]